MFGSYFVHNNTFKDNVLGDFWKKRLANYIEKQHTYEKKQQIYEEVSAEINKFMNQQYNEKGINVKPKTDDQKIKTIQGVLEMFDKGIPDIILETAPKISEDINTKVIGPAIEDQKEYLKSEPYNFGKNKEIFYPHENDELNPLLPNKKTNGGKSKKSNKRNKRRNTHTRRKLKTRK